MFEAFIEQDDDGKYILVVRGHVAGVFSQITDAYHELQELIDYEVQGLKQLRLAQH